MMLQLIRKTTEKKLEWTTKKSQVVPKYYMTVKIMKIITWYALVPILQFATFWHPLSTKPFS